MMGYQGEQRLFYESPKIANKELDTIVGPVIGEFVLAETTRAGAEEHPLFVRRQWNHLPLPVRSGQIYEELNDIQIFASDALAVLALNYGSNSPIVSYWENLTKDTGLGETFGFDLDQGELTLSKNVFSRVSPKSDL